MYPYNFNNINIGAGNQGDGFIKVDGVKGAQEYQLLPNSKMPLFDKNNDIFYVKSTDAMGNSSIDAFRFEKIQAEQMEFVTREDLNTLREDVKNDVKQLIQEFAVNTAGANTESNAGNAKRKQSNG